ncbi:group II intron maturase-specific domain-containing protein [Paraflavitalea speifideaquila]|uniref:group II intron maturase-specific domain-containing protein n=1 Tax=Paraflavitalea speifideaquila TaxID=3076558 RepID=UPI0028EDBB91|nr:group II intron maturase-specific domain-containing protein [Paraflavitalea speifideiaquila]
MSYSFQPRTIKDKFGRKNRLVVFSPAISQMAKTNIRKVLKEILKTRWSDKSLEWFADVLNPKIRGWMNYYTKFNRIIGLDVFYYLNELIRQWVKNTYKIKGKVWLYEKYRNIQAANPDMFYHCRLGVKA